MRRPSPRPMMERMSDADQVPSQEQPEGVLPTLFSLVLGTAELGLEAVAGRLRSLDSAEPQDRALAGAASEDPSLGPVPQAEPAEGLSATLPDLAIGFVYRSGEVVAGFTARSRAALHATGAAAAAAARVVGADRAASSVTRVRMPLVGSIGDLASDLAAVGRERRADGRVLVRVALVESIDSSIRDVSARVVQQVSSSQEVREVIRVQTTSAGQVVASEIRDVAREADQRLDRGIGRLLRRNPRSPADIVPAGGGT